MAGFGRPDEAMKFYLLVCPHCLNEIDTGPEVSIEFVPELELLLEPRWATFSFTATLRQGGQVESIQEDCPGYLVFQLTGFRYLVQHNKCSQIIESGEVKLKEDDQLTFTDADLINTEIDRTSPFDSIITGLVEEILVRRCYLEVDPHEEKILKATKDLSHLDYKDVVHLVAGKISKNI